MKDKEVIEEMAKEFCSIYIDPTHEDCELCKQSSNGNCDALKKIKKFIKNYLPKDSVVLSKEEYEELLDRAETAEDIANTYKSESNNMAIIDYHKKQSSKETAEKILNKFDDMQENLSKKIKQLKEPFNYRSMNSNEKEGYINGILVAKSIVTSFKSQLAKQFGVEIKEN